MSDAGTDAWLACCIPDALLQEVRDACAIKRASLVSVRPYFAAAWRRAGTAVHGKSGWFVVQERKRLVAGFVSKGRWIHLVSRRSGERIEAVLDVLDRERELLAEHHDERTVWLYGAVPAGLAGSHRDYHIEAVRQPDLDGLSAGDRGRYAMAA